MARQRNPLEPVATSVSVVLGLLGVLLALTLVGTVFGSGELFGIGSRSACVDVRNGTVAVPQQGGNVVDGVRDHVTSSARTVGLCVESPTAGQRLLNTLAQIPTFLVLIGALSLAWWLIRSASRDGIFTRRTSNRLRVLGWFVSIGQPVATLIEAVARQGLAGTMVVDPLPVMSFVGDWDLPVLMLLVGAVLISMARIMRISTAMREDLEGIV